ncbi:MAG: hypoxanthine-guanine phosphoribosyltransferase [Gammaproteobacteria bacterium]|nr:hypoxanthine-guanine phosphoribosyltransferase [Gammaproteobacteria bacterium]
MDIPTNFSMLFSNEEIERAIDRVAVGLNIELEGKDVVFVCVMHGGLPFTWDLMRRVDFNVSLDFVRVQRYDGTTGGQLRTERDYALDLHGKHVVVVDDVLDRGVTLSKLYERFSCMAEQVWSAVLCDKKCLREVDIEADFVALNAPDRYLIGRGMDMDGMYRQLPAIYAMNDE